MTTKNLQPITQELRDQGVRWIMFYGKPRLLARDLGEKFLYRYLLVVQPCVEDFLLNREGCGSVVLNSVTADNFEEIEQPIMIDLAKEGSDTTVTSIHHKGELPKYLLDAIEKYNNEPKERTPSDKKIYYFVNSKGEVITTVAQGDLSDKRRFEQNNFFSTEKEARMHSLRIQGMSVKNTAKEGGEFWYYGFFLEGVHKGCAWDAFCIEPKFKTKQEAENWGKKYSEAFKFFNK